MALILGMLGGAAVVEIHRAITGQGHGNKNTAFLDQKRKQQEMLSVIDGLKTREKELDQAIRELEEELEGHANRNELSEAERKRLERVCAQLKEQLAEAETKHRELSKKYHDLEETNKKIQEREELLEGCVESLKAENSMLISQFERLKVKHEEETAAFEKSIKMLQQNVSNVLTQYIQNTITVKGMSEELHRLGVEFSCPKEEEVMAQAATVKERKAAVDQLKLKVDEDSFFNQMHLTSSPTRAAQLFFTSALSSGSGDVRGNEHAHPSRPSSAQRELSTSMMDKMNAARVANDTDGETIAALHPAPATSGGVKEEQHDRKQKKKFFGKPAKVAASKQPLLEVEVPIVLSKTSPYAEGETISV